MSDAKMFVKPAEGRLVRDPATRKPLSAEGAWVPRSSFYLRRLRVGDVAAAEGPAAPDAAAAKPARRSREETSA